jgi:hypothetical protein
MTVVAFNRWAESDQEAVREQLDRVLKSPPFLQSRRRQRFLQYIVNETLAGRGDRLKGYAIARDVFDRPEDFDANVDPIVRMEAGRLRDRLREYYDAAGKDDPILIELPKGTYTPQISFHEVGGAVEDQDHGLEETSAAVVGDTPLPRRRWWKSAKVGLPLLAFILLIAAGAWLAVSLWRTEPKETTSNAGSSLAEVPAVAVLPFVNLSSDPKQD